MPDINTYNDLVLFLAQVKKGDTIIIGNDGIRPLMADTLDKLTVTPLTVITDEVINNTEVGTIILTGKCDLLDVASMQIRLLFRHNTVDNPSGAFALTITANPPEGTEFTLVPQFSLSQMQYIIAPEQEFGIYTIHILCSILIGGNDGLLLPVRLDVPAYEGDWLLAGEFAAKPLTASSLKALTGDLSLTDNLPAPLNLFEKFALTHAELSFDPVKEKFSYISFNVNYTDGWSILDVIKVPPSGTQLIFTVDFLDKEETYIELISQFQIGGKNIEIGAHFAEDNFFVWGQLVKNSSIALKEIFSYLKVTPPNGFPEVEIDNLGLMVDISNSSCQFNLRAKADAGDAFKMSKLTIDVVMIKSVVNAEFAASMLIDRATSIDLEAKYNGNGGGIILKGEAKHIPIGKLLAYLADQFGIGDVPDMIKNLKVSSISVSYDTKTTDFEFQCTGNCKYDNVDVELCSQIKLVHTATGYTSTFSGQFTIGGQRFNIDFIKTGAGYSIRLSLLFVIKGVTIKLAASAAKSGESITEKTFSGGTRKLNLSVTDIITDLIGAAVYADFPQGLLPNIELTDAYIYYNGTTKDTSVIALTAFGDQQIRLRIHKTKNSDNEPIYVFSVDNSVPGLENLPLVGGEMVDVRLSDVGFTYTSAAGEYVLPVLSAPKDDGMPVIEFVEKTTYKAGFTLGGQIKVPGKDAPVALVLPVSKSPKVKATRKKHDTYSLTGNAADTFEPAVKWVNINKKIGPLAVSKIGFQFAEGRLFLLIGGSLALSGLSINVEGLGMSFLLNKLLKGDNIEPQFNLSGLGLALKQEPLEISGSLLRITPAKDEAISFYGAAQISTSAFSIKGIGAYAKLKSGDDSLFVYGLYSGPIGGPAFFFVTGIAAGFGYNRTVRIPALQEVKDFPLVALALNPDPVVTNAIILQRLVDQGWIPSSPGNYWMALGVRFTSFKIIESFVLVTVNFGGKVEFAIIGLSLLKWPNTGRSIVYIELALLARFGPDNDVIAVTGMLTPNSYIFDKNCKLTGGFAFYSWISGPHEGDFVITLGGYSPGYKIPDHYPNVERLALNWKFSDELSIRGEMYFALTPRKIMAGGRWEIFYNLSFLSARVTIWADMMIKWAPFTYYLSAGIIVRIEANIKIAFIHIYFKVQMGCEVQIWGPPFAGQIYVDWSIFSFTIPFGSTARRVEQKLQWDNSSSNSDGFKESFVPLDKETRKPDALNLRVVSGAMNETDEGNKNNYVNSYELVIAVDSFFPLKDIHAPDNKPKVKGLRSSAEIQYKPLGNNTLMEVAGQDIPKTLDKREQSFGIKPMGIEQLDTELRVGLFGEDGKPVTENVSLIATAKGVNSALWGHKNNDDKDVIKNVVSGVQLHMIEKAAGDTVVVDLDRIHFEEKNTEIQDLQGITAGSQKDIEGRITRSLESSVAQKTVDELIALGFTDLNKPAKLLLKEIVYSTPYRAASLGQMVPIDPIA